MSLTYMSLTHSDNMKWNSKTLHIIVEIIQN